MQFNSNSDNQDIVSDITFLTGLDTNSFTLKDRARCVNERYRLVWQMIFESYGGWTFMDDNVSDTSTGIPYADQTITSGTGLYSLPSSALTVRSVEVKNSGGTYEVLKPISHEEFMMIGGDATFTSNSTPLYYMLQGDVLRLLPIPNYTVSSTGIRVFFDQDISAFASTDTTKTPGFASIFHRMLSIGAALDFCMTRAGMEQKTASLSVLWNDYETRLRKFYSKRFKDRFPGKIMTGLGLVEQYS